MQIGPASKTYINILDIRKESLEDGEEGYLATKIRKTDEYIPFGPFIVIAAIITIFVPFELIVGVLLEIFTLGMYAG